MTKYNEVLRPFTAAMERELHANSRKGDRPAWLQLSAATLMLELLYHHSKLQVALDAGDGDRIMEYTADIANISMMIADVCGALSLVPVPAELKREPIPVGTTHVCPSSMRATVWRRLSCNVWYEWSGAAWEPMNVMELAPIFELVHPQ